MNSYFYASADIKCPYNTEIKNFLYQNIGADQGTYIDRFNKFPLNDNNFRFVNDIAPVFINKTLKQICIERVQQIISKNKSIIILSSGGIDSLTVIASFILAGYKDKITVIQMKDNTLDNELVQEFNNIGITYNILNDFTELDITNYVIVDGQCGDQITNISAHYASEKDLAQLELNEEVTQWFTDAPITLDTTEKKLWYINFCFKWRICAYVHMPRWIYRSSKQIIDYNYYFPFFASEDFSNYAISNFNTIMADEGYKTAFKEIIYQAINNEIIVAKINNTEKIRSIHTFWQEKLSTDNNNIYKKRLQRFKRYTLYKNDKFMFSTPSKMIYQYANSVNNKTYSTTRKNMSIVASMPKLFIDRFGILEDHRKINYDRLPMLTNKTFKELCIVRAQQLCQIAGIRKIAILSSGGIDSLTVITAFILANASNKIEIYELQSNETNTDIINYYNSHGIQYNLCTTFNPNILDNKLVIDGNCADQLVHSVTMFDESAWFDDTPNLTNIIQKRQQAFQKLKSDTTFLSWIHSAPMELTTNDEIMWYISYACKWRTTQYQHLPVFLEKYFNYIININNYYAFFATNEFSDWAFTHFKENVNNDHSDTRQYKLFCKEIIIETIDDDILKETILNKGKSMSLNHDNVTNTIDTKNKILYNQNKISVKICLDNTTNNLALFRGNINYEYDE